jgi:hypothetical protein
MTTALNIRIAQRPASRQKRMTSVQPCLGMDSFVAAFAPNHGYGFERSARAIWERLRM